MPTSTTVLTDYVNLMKEQPDHYLGLLVLYSVSELTVPHAELKSKLEAVGLGAYVPRRPADVDVFRRTAKGLQRNRQEVANQPGVHANVMVRDVANDDTQVVSRVVCEIVDKDLRTLGYSETYELTFTKPTRKTASDVDIRRIGAAIHPAADEVAMEIKSEYQRLAGTVGGTCVRTVIGRILDGADATSLRKGGGSYFVDRSQAHIVAGLEDFASSIPGTQVHSVPLPDDTKQRTALVSAFEDQAKVDIERQSAELAELLRKGEPVTPQKTLQYLTQHRAIAERATRYAELLETTMTSTRSALLMLERQTAQLVGLGTRDMVAKAPGRKAAA